MIDEDREFELAKQLNCIYAGWGLTAEEVEPIETIALRLRDLTDWPRRACE